MGEYDFILDNLVYSFSSIGTYGNCNYGFKLTYIDYLERKNNWYAEFGSFFHLVLEKFFKKELDTFELTPYFEENYATAITCPPPPFPANITDSYYKDAVNFFDVFNFPRNKYEILCIEDGYKLEYEGVKLIVKPDLILKNKETGEVMLLDYKTSNPFKNGKPDKKKIEDYTKQMYLYCYFFEMATGIHIDTIKIWFVRINKWEEIKYDWAKAQEVVAWFYGEIGKIKQENEFLPNNKNKFFCQQLCSVSQHCQYKP